MAGDKQSATRIVWHQVAIIERFSCVLYPIDILELLRSLPNIAYVVPDLTQRGTIEPGRPLAVKGDIELVINQDNKTIGAKGREVEPVVAGFQELRRFYQQHLAPSPGLAIHYVEFTGEGWAESNKNPVEAMAAFWANSPSLRALANVVGTEATNYGIELAPPKDPNDPTWFHITVEPLVASSSRRYRTRYVWRGPNVDEMLGKFSKVDDTLRRLISKIEDH